MKKRPDPTLSINLKQSTWIDIIAILEGHDLGSGRPLELANALQSIPALNRAWNRHMED